MYKAHCGAFTAENVAANTDLTAAITPEGANNFKLIAFEINCDVAARIAINENDVIICLPAAVGYAAKVNRGGGDYFVDVEKIKLLDACENIALTYFYSKGAENANA